MGYIPCSRCHDLQREKLASIYWAWFVFDDRHAWKEQLCDRCVDTHLRPLAERQVLREHERQLGTCDNCGIDAETVEVQRNFGMCFLRGNDPVQLRLLFCEACGELARGQIEAGGERLPDRISFTGRSDGRKPKAPLAPLTA